MSSTSPPAKAAWCFSRATTSTRVRSRDVYARSTPGAWYTRALTAYWVSPVVCMCVASAKHYAATLTQLATTCKPLNRRLQPPANQPQRRDRRRLIARLHVDEHAARHHARCQVLEAQLGVLAVRHRSDHRLRHGQLVPASEREAVLMLALGRTGQRIMHMHVDAVALQLGDDVDHLAVA